MPAILLGLLYDLIKHLSLDNKLINLFSRPAVDMPAILFHTLVYLIAHFFTKLLEYRVIMF